MRGRSSSKIKGTGRKTFAIVVDGETEMYKLFGLLGLEITE
jgi:hypothetical protein